MKHSFTPKITAANLCAIYVVGSVKVTLGDNQFWSISKIAVERWEKKNGVIIFIDRYPNDTISYAVIKHQHYILKCGLQGCYLQQRDNKFSFYKPFS